MHGPPLSPSEVVASLECKISDRQAAGLSREAAITAVADHYGAERYTVAFLVGDRVPAGVAVEAA